MVPRPDQEPQVLPQTPQAGPVPAKAPKSIAAWYYQLKTGHALTATHMKTISCEQMISAGGVTGQTDPETPFQALCPVASSEKGNVGQSAEGNEARKRKWKMAELFADERCSEAILELHRTMDVDRKVTREKARGGEQRVGDGTGVPEGRVRVRVVRVVERDSLGSLSYVYFPYL